MEKFEKNQNVFVSDPERQGFHGAKVVRDIGSDTVLVKTYYGEIETQEIKREMLSPQDGGPNYHCECQDRDCPSHKGTVCNDRCYGAEYFFSEYEPDEDSRPYTILCDDCGEYREGTGEVLVKE